MVGDVLTFEVLNFFFGPKLLLFLKITSNDNHQVDLLCSGPRTELWDSVMRREFWREMEVNHLGVFSEKNPSSSHSLFYASSNSSLQAIHKFPCIFRCHEAMIIIATIFAFALGIVGWIYVALKPPSPKICGTPNGPQVTSPRVKLNDGRHLAYKEFGVPREKAQYKIILSHGYNASKDMHIAVSQEFMEEVKAYMVIYDRAGYGESDPYPSRSVKTEAFDIEELADKLKLGSKFYVIGCSLGAYPIWGCLKYIPHRLLGASLVVPFVNYWWPSIPSTLSIQSFWKLPLCFKFTFGIAHYTPWLYYWWTKQKWYRSTGIEVLFTNSDLEILKDVVNCPTNFKEKIRQQGDYECLHRDVLVSFGKWEFDPTELTNPSTESIRSVHMWQGGADRVIPIEFSRFVAQKLPWIQYHEVPNAGHLIVHEGESLKAIIRALIAE